MPSIQETLNSIQTTFNTNTKEAAVTSPGASSVQAARDALNTALTGTTKEAGSVAQETFDVAKIASQLGDADFAARVKESELMGAAIFDGFIKRANQYTALKVAGDDDSDDAFMAGLRAKKDDDDDDDKKKKSKKSKGDDCDEKVAHDAMLAGGQAALEKVAQMSRDSFNMGYEHIQHVLANAQQG